MAARRGAPKMKLLVRPGARFTCSAVGLCCTDMHALGPLFPGDLVRLRRRGDDSTMHHERLGQTTIRTLNGACVFLEDTRCVLHGTEDKPQLCKRYPFGAVVTPEGLRITTAHRCPCRSLGERAAIDASEAEEALRGEGGELSPHAIVGPRVAITARTTVSFERYARTEATWMERLARGESPGAVMETPERWPEIRGPSWEQIARTLRAVDSLQTRFDLEIAWFAHGLLGLIGAADPAPERPWREAFDLAERQATAVRTGAEVVGDFLADSLWDMRWSVGWTFDRFAVDLVLRHAVATAIAEELTRGGARADRAAAEAVMIVEVAGDSAPWQHALARMEPLPVRLPGADRAVASGDPEPAPRPSRAKRTARGRC